MITKEQLQAMSDAQINESLHNMLGRFINGDGQITYILGDNVLYQNEGGTTIVTNYCNTPNDIMRLAFEYKLCLISPQSHTKTWSARQTDGGGLWSVSDFTYSDANPLRAIACCLILVLQEKQK